MAKAKMTPEESAAIIAAVENPAPANPLAVKKLQVGLPADILGSKFSFSESRNVSLEATALGVVMRSKESKRRILVPWANVRAAELFWDK